MRSEKTYDTRYRRTERPYYPEVQKSKSKDPDELTSCSVRRSRETQAQCKVKHCESLMDPKPQRALKFRGDLASQTVKQHSVRYVKAVTTSAVQLRLQNPVAVAWQQTTPARNTQFAGGLCRDNSPPPAALAAPGARQPGKAGRAAAEVVHG